jgi:hypothetical protein
MKASEELMPGRTFGELVSALSPVLFGIVILLLGYRVIGKKPGASPQYDQWHSKYHFMLKVVGVVLLFSGTALLILLPDYPSLFPPSSPEAERGAGWQRYTTEDGACSAEFPDTPKRDDKTAGGITSRRLTLLRHNGDVYYILSFSGYLAEKPMAVEERLDSIRDNLPLAGAQAGLRYELVSERRITDAGVPGRSLEYRYGEKSVLLTKVFISGAQMYRLIAVVPKTMKDDPETQHFLQSFRFEGAEK